MLLKLQKRGRHFSFSAIVVAGNENGIVGYGLGKANEVTTAIAKAVEDAKKNLSKSSNFKRNYTLMNKQQSLVAHVYF